MRQLEDVHPSFNRRPFQWLDVLTLGACFGVAVERRRVNGDAVLAHADGRRRISLSHLVTRDTWGIFCVVHELVRALDAAAASEFLLGSPGWRAAPGAPAATVALLALWPQGPPYPRILAIDLPDDDLIRLRVSKGGTVRAITLQRYSEPEGGAPDPAKR